MSFELSTRTVLWLPQWRTDGPLSYSLALLAVAALGIAHEALSARRLAAAAAWAGAGAAGGVGGGAAGAGGAGGGRASNDGGERGEPLLSASASPASAAAARRRRRERAGSYALSLVTSYLLMLAVMTYNVGVFAAVVAGMSTGFFWFGAGGGGGPSASAAAAGALASRARLLNQDPCCPQPL